MKFNTLLKAGTLAFDIMNHQSTQALSGLVKNGVKRRAPHLGSSALKTEDKAGAQKEPSLLDHFLGASAPHHPTTHMSGHSAMRANYPFSHQGHGATSNRSIYHVPQQPLPTEHIKKALKYVTPENMEKAMQWHGIIKSFISKE
ncbi:MAG: hypothetical protein OWR52_04855 [Acidibacillus sp.]|uniref:Uncharacterized protein n=1 Tax=Sulfoacidibacillus ferrooxidans TaxID=2005001 RepID=A0A9X1V628_9BACL|nr:hypothetical protein [Sulfoacidibacillus ferrooxidans]MCI0181877.1 hypothetical protein [Sulfoacidibacillus ferrooxidans]MCY0892826.1 hypothetical protein [Acidibacillus sp.]